MDRKEKTIVIIPDAYIGNASGAIVTQTITRLLVSLGVKVVIYSQDVEDEKVNKLITLKKRLPYRAISNYFEKKYKLEFLALLKKTNPHAVFFVGSITNKPLCYIDLAKEQSIRTIAMIFMQDFFCMKYYANDKDRECLACINGNYWEAYKKKCCGERITSMLKFSNNVLLRKRLKPLLCSLNCVITSSDQQISFYSQYGIPKQRCLKIPLFFDRLKLKCSDKEQYGDYFICIAQNRIEKGFHYLTSILEHCDKSIKILAAYNSEKSMNGAIVSNGYRKYINEGKLEVQCLTFQNGLKEAILKAKGVIIPSIWPTTTEFGLLEALGLKKIVYAFDAGIHKEIFKNGVNGFIAPVGDCISFADNLMTPLNESEREAIIAKSYQLYLDLTDDARWISDLRIALSI